MKKSAILTLIVFGLLPFSACNNSEQSGYMKTTSAEDNAREAEEAEQEYADLAAKTESTEKTGGKKTHGEKAKKVASHETKKSDRTPASKEPAHHAAVTPHDAGLWVVQLGAFKVKTNAEKLTSKLKDGGFPVVMRSMNHSKNGELFLVHLEPTPNRNEAEKWQSDLKLKSFDSTIISRHD